MIIMQSRCSLSMHRNKKDAARQRGKSTMTDMIKTGFFSKIKSSFWGRVFYSTMTGLFGSLLLVLFLTGLMPLGATVRYLPWILGFNASLTGYTLVDRTGDRLCFPKLSGSGLGALVALLVCSLLNGVAVKTTGIALTGAVEMLVFLGLAFVSGGGGAWLAIAYARIQHS
jgi:hypothetical protein